MYPFYYLTKALRKKILAIRGVCSVCVVEYNARNLRVHPLQFFSLKCFLKMCILKLAYSLFRSWIRKDAYALEEVYPNISSYYID